MTNILYLLLSLIGVSITTSIIIEFHSTNYSSELWYRIIDILIRATKIFIILLVFLFHFFLISMIIQYMFKVMS